MRGPGPLVLWRPLETTLGLGRVGLSRGVVTPSAYEGGVSLRMGMPAAPQLVAARLLQRPSRLRNWSAGAEGSQGADPPTELLVDKMSSPSTHWDLRSDKTLAKKHKLILFETFTETLTSYIGPVACLFLFIS